MIDFLKPAEVAARLRVSRPTLWRICKRGDLKFIPDNGGRMFRFTTKQIADYVGKYEGNGA